MATHVVSRDAESQAVDEFLASVSSGPSALVLEGEAGIGKTTVWLAALERAQELGFRVMSSRTAAAESVLAYASLAALLDGDGRRRRLRPAGWRKRQESWLHHSSHSGQPRRRRELRSQRLCDITGSNVPGGDGWAWGSFFKTP